MKPQELPSYEDIKKQVEDFAETLIAYRKKLQKEHGDKELYECKDKIESSECLSFPEICFLDFIGIEDLYKKYTKTKSRISEGKNIKYYKSTSVEFKTFIKNVVDKIDESKRLLKCMESS